MVVGKPGDKENIPLSEKRSSARSVPEVIDLCEPDEENPSRMASVQRASSSSVPEVIDLCSDSSPIKRSVPSIAATLFPKKRKLDILRQGGLEVTAISSSAGGNNEPDVVTITKTVTSGSNANSDGERRSVEILDPKKYSSAGRNCNDGGNNRPKSSQILDLRTMRNNGDIDDESLLKKISPSLGPNIEISLVPTDDTNRDPKKRKSVQLPIPALRKISTGELSVKNLSLKVNPVNETSKYKPKVTIAAAVSRSEDADSSADVKPQMSPSASEDATESSSPSPASNLSSYVSNVNQSLYIAALYNSMFPPAVDGDSGDAGSNTYQQQLSFLADSLLQQQQQQQQQEEDVSLAQKFSSILKNNTVSIIENYENILPD